MDGLPVVPSRGDYLRDMVLGNETFMRNWLPRQPLVYFRLRALKTINADIGYVSILKDPNNKLHLHYDLGDSLVIYDLAHAWLFAGNDAERRAALNANLEYTLDHEAEAERFLVNLLSDTLPNSFSKACSGCLCPLHPPMIIWSYDGSRFCSSCWPQMCDGFVTLETLDECWLGVIPEWEDERGGQYHKLLDSPTRPWPQDFVLDPRRFDELAREIHWSEPSDLKQHGISWQTWMRQSFCSYEWGRLDDMVRRWWIVEHHREAKFFAELFPLNLYGIQFSRGDKEFRDRLDQVVYSSEEVQLLDRGAHQDSSDIARRLRSSADVRELIDNAKWMNSAKQRLNKITSEERYSRMNALDKLLEEELRCRIDFELKGRSATDIQTVHTDLQPLLMNAIEHEVIRMYDNCTNEPWREFIHLVHSCDSQLDLRPRDYMARLPPARTFRGRIESLWTLIGSHVHFKHHYRKYPRDLWLGIWLLREAEDFWHDYMLDKSFVAAVRRFLHTHDVVVLCEQKTLPPREGEFVYTPGWVTNLRRKARAPSRFKPLIGSTPLDSYDGTRKVSRVGYLGWHCSKDGCACASTV